MGRPFFHPRREATRWDGRGIESACGGNDRPACPGLLARTRDGDGHPGHVARGALSTAAGVRAASGATKRARLAGGRRRAARARRRPLRLASGARERAHRAGRCSGRCGGRETRAERPRASPRKSVYAAAVSAQSRRGGQNASGERGAHTAVGSPTHRCSRALFILVGARWSSGQWPALPERPAVPARAPGRERVAAGACRVKSTC